ncbi:ion channel [Jiella sp. M17.18]|uniref:ion channel n=1 Tax=Jiella sp. M17.18 TaxID=3234247 RepID=UPI0034DEFF7F
MPVLASFLRKVYVALAELTWTALLLIAVLHMALSFELFRLSGESGLAGDGVDFLYYYVVTATTVGYGDLSPATDAGRLAASFFVIPGAIAIFTATLGKLLAAVGTLWRRRMNGLSNFADRTGHIIVVGWHDGATRQLFAMLQAERSRSEPAMVLVAKALETNPLAGEIDFVHADRLADPEALERAGIAGARAIIVEGENDDETFAASLIAAALGESAHVVAYFQYDRTAEILRRQNPRIEAVTSLSSELMVRAARDPGASKVAHLLLSAATADTAFSVRVPELSGAIAYSAALSGLKRLHKVTLVGMAQGGAVDLNCHEDAEIRAGDILYYISDHRLEPHAVAWDALRGTSR